MADFFHKSIEFLKGIGPEKAALINKELSYFNYGDLLQHYPFRYEDRTSFHKISSLTDGLANAQIIGKITLKSEFTNNNHSNIIVTNE